jgi:protein-S-isoprenylcysteine O-methyltransferase Ste14
MHGESAARSGAADARDKTMKDLPVILLTATIWTYWFIVGAMIVRVRRKTRKLSGVVPRQPLEQFMWVVWVPLVIAWMALPYLAATGARPPWALPDFAREQGTLTLRWIAAIVGLACLALSVECWTRMGKNWRMAVAPDQKTDLVTTGLYAYIRHPIYALSILLMLCSALIVPTIPMAAVAAVHVVLMRVKARNEERFLTATLGKTYQSYCRQTGRFVPRFGARGSKLEGSS